MKLAALSLLAAALTGAVMGSPVLPRQDSSSVSSTSASATDSVSSATAATTTAASTSSASTSASASADTNSAASTTASASATGTTSTASQSVAAPSSAPSGVTVCTQDDANNSGFYPFCTPKNGANLTVGTTIYLTWYTGAFSNGTSIIINLDYPNMSQNAWHSDPTDKNLGYVYLSINDSLLSGTSTAYNLTLVSNNAAEGASAQTVNGPYINVVAVPGPAAPAHTPFNVLGLAIGLPVALVVVFGVLAVFCCVIRKQRSGFSGLKILSRRKGYGVGKSRRQRMGDGLDADFDASAPIYHDDPAGDFEFHKQYNDTTREERSVRAMGAFSNEGNLHSTR